jgi:hypothetical protein
MTPADDYIRKAVECLALARRAPDRKDRAYLIELAAKWRDLASARLDVVMLAGEERGLELHRSNAPAT